MDKQAIRDTWMGTFEDNREILEERVPADIEKYRKGYCKLRFTDADGKPLAGKKVKITQKTHDFKYGANIFMLDEFESEEDNRKYRALFKEYFNLATIPFYWDGLEPEEGQPRFAKDSKKVYRRPAPDLCLDYCDENGIEAKLHCLVYDKFTPKWAREESLEQLEKRYHERIRQIAERYSGRLREFEVINEVLCVPEWKHITPISGKRDIVNWAFDLARRYLPNETLVINENRTFFHYDDGYKYFEDGYRHPYFMMIDNALQRGATIDKIGLQYHIFTGVRAKTEADHLKDMENDAWKTDPAMLTRLLDIFADFKLPMEITEMTLPTLGDTPEDETLQAEVLKNVYSVLFSHPFMDSIVYWNTVDGFAFESSSWNENHCRGGLFRHDLSPKQSALMLKKLFTEVWHTDLEAETDADGEVAFRGFFGDYSVNADGKEQTFGIHQNTDNTVTVTE